MVSLLFPWQIGAVGAHKHVTFYICIQPVLGLFFIKLFKTLRIGTFGHEKYGRIPMKAFGKVKKKR
jgi:hypothetical protein